MCVQRNRTVLVHEPTGRARDVRVMRIHRVQSVVEIKRVNWKKTDWFRPKFLRLRDDYVRLRTTTFTVAVVVESSGNVRGASPHPGTGTEARRKSSRLKWFEKILIDPKTFLFIFHPTALPANSRLARPKKTRRTRKKW